MTFVRTVRVTVATARTMHAPTLFIAAVVLPLTCKSGLSTPVVQSRMKQHDQQGLAIRDAIVRGDLAAAKDEATVLLFMNPEGSPRDAWTQHLSTMNAAAAWLGSAPSLEAAAQALGPLAKTCGDCHSDLKRPFQPLTAPAEQAAGVRPKMVRHEWAASRMWDGLVVPSDDAWMAGARVLSEEPLSSELLTPGKSPVPRVGALEQSVHDLGRQAETTRSADGRAQLYGEIAQTCSECHRWLGGGPGAK